ncbi:MAG: hypothetical protein ACJ75R_06605 [Solirubrobacterales bacterium]
MRSPRTSIALLAVGLACILLGNPLLYGREQIFNADELADKAVETLDDADVRDAVGNRVTEVLIRKVDPNLVSVKPILEAGTSGIVGTGAFKTVLHQAITNAYGSIVDGKDNTAVALANIGVLVTQALKQFQPELARKVPSGFDTTLVKVGKGGLATDVAQVAEKVRVLGLILPALGLLALAGSVAVAPDRRRSVIRAGSGLALVGLFAVAALIVVKAVIAAGIESDTNRGALDAIWSAFVGPLQTSFLIIGGFGLIVASAAASALRPAEHPALLRRAWSRVAVEPTTTRGRVLWAACLTAAGLLMIFESGLVVRLALLVGGAYLLSRAASTVIALAGEPVSADQSRAERRRILAWAGVSVATAALAGVVLVVILTGGAEGEHRGLEGSGCNGSDLLCKRSLDEVVFPATHNSYAGANYPGFLFPEQDNGIRQQLDAGVRGLWIDTYYGIPGRRVYTDTSKLDPALIAQIRESLGKQFYEAGNRIRAQIARPPAGAEAKIYLCHGFCELGAVSAEKTFRQIAQFMAENPREVLIIDIEDYTTPHDTQALIKKTGLVDYVYKGPQGPPWPTLEQMIKSGGRILLVAEHMTGGASWYRPLESTIQETPFQFKTPAQMTCRGGRGKRDLALFLINNWIDTDPTPRPTNAEKVNARKFLVDRARKCERQRQFANVLNVDFYKQGDLFGAIDELNGVR